MADTVVVVDDTGSYSIVVDDSAGTTSVSTNLSPTTIPSMSDIGNVDTTDLRHGSVLVYKQNTLKWTSTLTLDAQDMDAGEF